MKVSVFGVETDFHPRNECYAIIDRTASHDVVETMETAERLIGESGLEGVLLPFSPSIDCTQQMRLRDRLDKLTLSPGLGDSALVIVLIIRQTGLEDLVDVLLRLRDELSGFDMPSFTIVRGFDRAEASRAAAACGFVPLCPPDGKSATEQSGGLPASVLDIVRTAAQSSGDDLEESFAKAEAFMAKKASRIGFAS